MKRVSKVLSLVMALMLIFSASGAVSVKAEEKVFDFSSKDDPTVLINPGQTAHVTIPIKSKIQYYGAEIRSIEAQCIGKDGQENELIQIKNLKFVYKNNIKEEVTYPIYLYDYSSNLEMALDFDIVADNYLKIGANTIRISGLIKEMDYDPDSENEAKTMPLIDIPTRTTYEKAPAYLSVVSLEYKGDSFTPGNTQYITFNIKNEGELKVLNAHMMLDFGDSGIVPNFSVNRIKVGDIAGGETKSVSASVKILDTAKAGLQSFSVSFDSKDKSGNALDPFEQTCYITIKGKTDDGNTKTPQIEVSTTANYTQLKRGGKMKIPVNIRNNGKDTAKDVTLAITGGVGTDQGITKDYTTAVLKVGELAAGELKKVEVPITVADKVAPGLHEITFEINYKDNDGKEQTAETLTMYLEADGVGNDSIYNYLDIHGVSQSPSNPKAGNKMSVSFSITNNGNAAIKNLRVYGENLSATGFEPVSNEPYQTVGDLKAGATKKVSMSFRVGENATSGMGTLTIGYEFFDESGAKKNDSASVYILNISGKDPEDDKNFGRPKLIISDYSTDTDVLKAGESFNFNFSIKNTHQSKAAKNIKVTISQSEGIFAPSSGSNIFYVNEIAAGQIAVQNLSLKTKSDAVTGDYGLSILLEYEYDNMSETDQEKGGVSEENLIKLHATENYRPVIENISVDAYEGCYVGTPVDLSFEFYNMGKSTLGNVYVTVEGDFALANNSNMSYVGAVQGYGQEFVNPQIVALVEGEATGILTVHFEDSNGDEVTLSQEFTQFVQSMGGGEWGEDGPIDPGFDPGLDPGFDPEFDPEGGDEEGGFFAKIKPWMWITGASVIVLAVAVPLIIHGVKKSKKAKETVDEDEDY